MTGTLTGSYRLIRLNIVFGRGPDPYPARGVLAERGIDKKQIRLKDTLALRAISFARRKSDAFELFLKLML